MQSAKCKVQNAKRRTQNEFGDFFFGKSFFHVFRKVNISCCEATYRKCGSIYIEFPERKIYRAVYGFLVQSAERIRISDFGIRRRKYRRGGVAEGEVTGKR